MKFLLLALVLVVTQGVVQAPKAMAQNGEEALLEAAALIGDPKLSLAAERAAEIVKDVKSPEITKVLVVMAKAFTHNPQGAIPAAESFIANARGLVKQHEQLAAEERAGLAAAGAEGIPIVVIIAEERAAELKAAMKAAGLLAAAASHHHNPTGDNSAAASIVKPKGARESNNPTGDNSAAASIVKPKGVRESNNPTGDNSAAASMLIGFGTLFVMFGLLWVIIRKVVEKIKGV